MSGPYFGQEPNVACFQIVDATGHLDLARLLQLPEDWAHLSNLRLRLANIQFAHCLNKCVIFRIVFPGNIPDGSHSRPDFLQQSRQVSQLDTVTCPLHRTTIGVPHDKDQLGPGYGTGEFNASDKVRVGDIPRNPGVEDIAQPGIKDDFGWHPGINAPKDHRMRILTGSGDFLVVKHVPSDWLSRDKARVAFAE